MELKESVRRAAAFAESVPTQKSVEDAAKLFELGNQKTIERQYEQAIDCFTKAIRLNPNDSAYYGCRGYARFLTGDLTGAVYDFNKAIEFGWDDWKNHRFRAMAKAQLGDAEGAVRDYNWLIDMGFDDCDEFQGRGFAKIDLGDNEGAIEDLNKALSLECAHPEHIYFVRAFARFQILDLSGALMDLNKAADTNPGYPRQNPAFDPLYDSLTKLFGDKMRKP